ncbi:hypothetical protein MRB53_041223 [Persea americana]|nr:hypothetical protein MRB53_041223 [Persea americana]
MQQPLNSKMLVLTPADSFLQGTAANYVDEIAFTPPPTIVPDAEGGVAMPTFGASASTGSESDVSAHLKAQLLVRAYQARGHHKAKIDPLNIKNEAAPFGYADPKELKWIITTSLRADMNKEFELGPGILPRFKTDTRQKMTLREIIDACEKMYCSSVGVEYIHIPDREQCDWIRSKLFAAKYPNDKRFGLEGGESLIPEPSDEGSGDVKYHLGMNFERPTPSGKRVQLSLVANPSHLEAEDPVVLGKARAILHYNGDEKEARTAMGSFASWRCCFCRTRRFAIDKYVEQLIADKTFTAEDIDEHRKWVWGYAGRVFRQVEGLPTNCKGNETSQLEKIGKALSETPSDFNVHKNLKRILATRTKTVSEGKNIDMSTGEALAFGSLVLEGHHVRVSGQDVERGTFSQRHAVLHDQESEATYTPLKNLDKDQGSFVIANSSLSEYGALGFEYGYLSFISKRSCYLGSAIW